MIVSGSAPDLIFHYDESQNKFIYHWAVHPAISNYGASGFKSFKYSGENAVCVFNCGYAEKISFTNVNETQATLVGEKGYVGAGTIYANSEIITDACMVDDKLYVLATQTTSTSTPSLKLYEMKGLVDWSEAVSFELIYDYSSVLADSGAITKITTAYFLKDDDKMEFIVIGEKSGASANKVFHFYHRYPFNDYPDTLAMYDATYTPSNYGYYNMGKQRHGDYLIVYTSAGKLVYYDTVSHTFREDLMNGQTTNLYCSNPFTPVEEVAMLICYRHHLNHLINYTTIKPPVNKLELPTTIADINCLVETEATTTTPGKTWVFDE